MTNPTQIARAFLYCSILLLRGSPLVQADDLQPKAVKTIERNPARKVLGSISLPEGSPWCDGKPTYWLIGHQPKDESPWCLANDNSTANFSNYNYTFSQWEMSSVAILDTQDELNVIDGPRNLDRHDCTLVDANDDGLPDVVCGVGANSGRGNGFNELYLTQAEDSALGAKGSLVKILEGHGLHLFPTMRNRFAASLKAADGSTLVILATRGQPRDDGEPNQHRMFRLQHQGPLGYFFEHVPGPWIQYTKASCLHIVDVNNDGLDDILMCNERKLAFIFLQHPDSSWTQVEVNHQNMKDWRNARVADIDGDGLNDLVVVGFGGRKTKKPTSYIRIYKGTGEYPFFDFKAAGQLFEQTTPYATPDVEVCDVNADGYPDLYVVQVDELQGSGKYCAKDWDKPYKGPRPPASFVPDADLAPDLLLLGSETGFTAISMTHSEPGCGNIVEKFGGNQTLLLAQGTMGRPGHNLLLQW